LADIDRLTALIEPLATAQRFELVRVAFVGGARAPTLQVMAEDPATGQLTIEQCTALSRAISALFDEVDPIEHEYQLEVSSPGIDRPLTRRKDWADWAGHAAKATLATPLAGQKKFQGAIGPMTETHVRVGDADLPFADIVSAKLVLTDALIAATRPLSTEGADEIEEEENVHG
jgi:ribosome maturation factor RimP